MEREKLAEEIIDFCNTYKIFSKQKILILERNRVLEKLEDISFIENLIHVLILKSKRRKNIDNTRLKKLLVALEKERLDLEYDE